MTEQKRPPRGKAKLKILDSLRKGSRDQFAAAQAEPIQHANENFWKFVVFGCWFVEPAF